MIHKATVREQKVYWQDKERLEKQLTKLEWKSIKIDIKEIKDARTVQQNRFYWWYILKHAADWIRQKHWFEFTEEDLHWFFKVEIAFMLTDQEFENLTTSTMDSTQFTRYIESIKECLSAKWQVTVPELWEDQMLAYYEQFITNQ